MSSSRTLNYLEELLPATSHMPGTSAKEQGLEVSIEKLPGELICFFHMDHDETKKCLKMLGKDIRCNDYLIFYTRNPNVKEVLCLLELKGKDFHHAVDQIISTYERFYTTIGDTLDRTNCQHIWSVNICLRGGSLQVDDKRKKRLEQIFGRANVRIKQVNKKDTQLADELLRKIG